MVLWVPKHCQSQITQVEEANARCRFNPHNGGDSVIHPFYR